MEDADFVDDDELLFRKISVNSTYYDLSRDEVSPQAFNPRKEDTTGLSVDRAQSSKHANFRSPEQAAIGRSPNGYYVAVLRAGDLRKARIDVVSRPLPEGPDHSENLGHAEIPNLTYENRKSDRGKEIMKLLAHGLTIKVEGPFNVP